MSKRYRDRALYGVALVSGSTNTLKRKSVLVILVGYFNVLYHYLNLMKQKDLNTFFRDKQCFFMDSECRKPLFLTSAQSFRFQAQSFLNY